MRTPVHRSLAAARAVVSVVPVLWLMYAAGGHLDGASQRPATPSAAVVTGAWIREVPPGETWTAAYATVANPSSAPVSLVGIDASFARVVELHDTVVEHDTMRMKRIQAIVVPPKGSVSLKPGGLHAMVFGLTGPRAVGERVTLVFRFSDGQVTVPAVVRPRLAVQP